MFSGKCLFIEMLRYDFTWLMRLRACAAVCLPLSSMAPSPSSALALVPFPLPVGRDSLADSRRQSVSLVLYTHTMEFSSSRLLFVGIEFLKRSLISGFLTRLSYLRLRLSVFWQPGRSSDENYRETIPSYTTPQLLLFVPFSSLQL